MYEFYWNRKSRLPKLLLAAELHIVLLVLEDTY